MAVAIREEQAHLTAYRERMLAAMERAFGAGEVRRWLANRLDGGNLTRMDAFELGFWAGVATAVLEGASGGAADA